MGLRVQKDNPMTRLRKLIGGIARVLFWVCIALVIMGAGMIIVAVWRW